VSVLQLFEKGIEMMNRRRVVLFTAVTFLFPTLTAVLAQELTGPPTQQPSRELLIYSVPVAERALQREGIDPKNVELLRSLVQQPFTDFRDHRPGLAAILLADRGEVNLIPVIKQRFQDYLAVSDEGPEHFLYALYFLKAPGVQEIAHQYLDTLLIERYGYLYFSQAFGALRVLVKLGDYSGFDACERIVAQAVHEGTSVDVQLLEQFGKRPELRPRVFSAFQLVLTEGRWPDRRDAAHAVANVMWDYPGTQSLLRQAVLSDEPLQASNSDPSFQARSAALFELQVKYNDRSTLDIAERTALNATDKQTIAFAAGLLLRLNSPFALVYMEKIYREITDTEFRAFFDPRGYEAPKMLPWEPLMPRLDSLVAFIPQVSGLGWLSDENFVNELDNGLENARKHLARGDSVNAYKEVEKFQQKIQKEYDKTQENQKKNKPKDKRFVTTEGYKFLYYSAQYILDRLPAEKTKKK
jgi:hypothetical protein